MITEPSVKQVKLCDIDFRSRAQLATANEQFGEGLMVSKFWYPPTLVQVLCA